MLDQQNKDQSSFLPNFCSAYVLLIVIMSAEMLAIILSLSVSIYSSDILYELAIISLFIQWIALSCVGLLCISRQHIAKMTEPVAISFCFILIMLVTLIITELAWYFLYSNLPEGIRAQQHLHFTLRALGISAIVGIIVLRYLYVQHQWRKNIEATAASRFEALQSRIRPHFLFNCMNTIASLTRKSPTQAEQSIEDLADLFRASLLEPLELTRIKNEWQLCETYLRIEQHRLGDRLIVDWQIQNIPDETLIPPLSIQPLIENGIYHGIECLADGGTITINGQLEDDIVSIQIKNPIPENKLDDKHQGTKQAQGNIQQRIKTLFGDQGDLKIDISENSYIVTLTVPFRTQ